jgi:uncharacterized protein (TIGR02300 family)
VAKPEWGTKHQCPKCGTRFYDLGNDDPVHCINCGHEWKPEPILKSKQPLPYAEERPVAAAVAVDDGEVLADDALIAEDDLEEDADESVGDVSLDDDDADLSEVVDKDMEDE